MSSEVKQELWLLEERCFGRQEPSHTSCSKVWADPPGTCSCVEHIALSEGMWIIRVYSRFERTQCLTKVTKALSQSTTHDGFFLDRYLNLQKCNGSTSLPNPFGSTLRSWKSSPNQKQNGCFSTPDHLSCKGSQFPY